MHAPDWHCYSMTLSWTDLDLSSQPTIPTTSTTVITILQQLHRHFPLEFLVHLLTPEFPPPFPVQAPILCLWSRAWVCMCLLRMPCLDMPCLGMYFLGVSLEPQAMARLPSMKASASLAASRALFHEAIQSKVMHRGDHYRPVTSKDTKDRWARASPGRGTGVGGGGMGGAASASVFFAKRRCSATHAMPRQWV